MPRIRGDTVSSRRGVCSSQLRDGDPEGELRSAVR